MTPGRPIIFGEVLFDCFPDGTEVLGGAPFNVAWHLQAFGLSPVLISRIGDDKRGIDILRAMGDWQMDTQCIQIDLQRPTGTVKIDLDHGEPTFTISPEDAYGYIQNDITEPLFNASPLLYHGSLALWNQQSRKILNKMKERESPEIFIDVNLRSPWWERDTVLSLLENASWVKLNEEELQLLIPQSDNTGERARILLDSFQIQVLILTRGSRGATVYLHNGQRLHITPGTQTKVVDTVGAGDAFSAVFILGLLKEWPLEKVIHYAQEFASIIVGQRGATIADRQLYYELLTKWKAV